MSRFSENALPCFCDLLLLAILGQLGDWLRFANLQDVHFGEVKNARKTIGFSLSEAFQAPKLFDRGSDGPNLGPLDFSREKYKGPMAPLNENNVKIQMKMHCQDFEKCTTIFL